MWVCQSSAAPGVLFSSTSDQTGFLPGWVCEKVAKPLPVGGPHAWWQWWKIAQVLEGGL